MSAESGTARDGRIKEMIAPYKVTTASPDDLPGMVCMQLEMPLSFEENDAEYHPLPTINIGVYDDHIHLSGLWVPHAMRTKGLGGVLMANAIHWATAAAYGKVPILLDARPFGREAPTVAALRRFYERFGFQRWPHHPTSMVLWPKEERA